MFAFLTAQNLHKLSESLTQETWWSEAWVRHLEKYLQAVPRAGAWLRHTLPGDVRSVVEIGGGSCRDSGYLGKKGLDAIGTDFDQKTIDYLKQRFPQSKTKFIREDAFRLSFEDRSVDATFHNGLWVLFRKDEDVRALAKEQLRVSRKLAVGMVHNAENHRLVARFQALATNDELYNIRFFTRDEVNGVLRSCGIDPRRIRLAKFGGPADKLYTWANQGRFSLSVARRLAPTLYAYQPWSFVERIAFLIDCRE